MMSKNNTEFRGGGGQKTKFKTPSPNFEDLIESIPNILQGDVGEKVMRCQTKFGGGGGGGGVFEFLE